MSLLINNMPFVYFILIFSINLPQNQSVLISIVMEPLALRVIALPLALRITTFAAFALDELSRCSAGTPAAPSPPAPPAAAVVVASVEADEPVASRAGGRLAIRPSLKDRFGGTADSRPEERSTSGFGICCHSARAKPKGGSQSEAVIGRAVANGSWPNRVPRSNRAGLAIGAAQPSWAVPPPRGRPFGGFDARRAGVLFGIAARTLFP